MDPNPYAALGVYGVTVGILMLFIAKVWVAYQDSQRQRVEEQKVAIPALERAADSLSRAISSQATTERLVEDLRTVVADLRALRGG